MKKYLFILLAFFSLSFSSCIVVDENPYYYEPCIDYIDYRGHNQVGGTIYIYFDNYCYETKSFKVFIEDPFGSDYINGRYWRPASSTFFSDPIMLQRYSYGISPNRSYRCIIKSSDGYISQEFVVYVY